MYCRRQTGGEGNDVTTRKRRKVPVDTHTVPSIPGIDPRPHQYARFPEREEGHQSVATGILAPSTEPSASENLAEALRTSVQSARVSPHGGDTYSADPTYAPQSVDASLGQPISPDIPRPRIAQRAGVVGIAGQPDGGPAVSQARSDYDDSHGCLNGGLGRSPRRLGDLRSVAAGLGQAPHQLARTAGSMADSAAFSASGTGHCCGCPYGQYHYSGLHQQGGWNSIPHLVLPGTGPVGLVQATRDLPGCQPHIGSQERPGGRPVQGETQPPYGVVPPQDSGSAHIRALADSPCGSLRVREEPQTSSVLLSAPLSDVERNKRSDAELGESVRVRVPADQPHPEGIEETEAAVVSPDPPSSPVLAQPAVVPSADQHADRPSASDHTQGQPPEELGHGDVLPQTGQNETGCMAAVRKSFVDRGFSQGVAETAARARRESTCRLYDSRLLHYRRWCVERGVGPAEAPVAEVAEFLNGLRTVKHKGKPLAPSTIAGYKSAIAAIHRGFPDGTTVSSNTDLSTLIKGLFVVSARPRTLNETWDLPTVLKYLAGPPFEPIHTAPLRSVAVKTAFLLQLASARRGSWVHSCRIDACHLRWENGGVRLLPSLLLDKNQSVSFTPSEVFLLSLKEFSPDDKVHCPVRALKWYLELTKPLRGDEKALFIRSREPYTKATKSTVAGWVKEAIAGAFSHLPKERRQRMGIRAHDTRGVATTWATMAGVPFEAIMEFSVFATPTSRAVEAPALWARDGVSKIACTVDDRRVVKEAGSFGDSTLARFFPLVEEDETLLKVLEVDAEVTEYMRSTYKLDWDPAKPFGPKGPHPVTKEAERFAKQVESTSSLLARLSIYLQRTQGFISATIVSREKERAALLAGLTPPPMPECMVDETLAGAVSLANYLTAAIGRISTRQKLEAGFDRRIRFLSAALAENKKVVPTMARLRLRELPLTKGLMFVGQWTQTVESTTKTQLLSASQAQLARDQPSTSKQSGDRFRIPFKKGRGSGGKYNKKGKKGGGGSNSSSSEGGGGRGTGRGRGRGRGGGAKKDAYSTYNTPKPAPKADAE